MEKTAISKKDQIYDSTKRGPLALEELLGVFQYRDLIYQLVQRDIVSRYKRSVLGVAWTLLNPLGTMLVMTIVFSQLFDSVKGYPTYILSGLIAWNFFSQTTNSALQQMIWGSALLHRIYMPRTAFAVSSIGTGLVNLFLSLIPLVIIMFITAIPLHWSLLFLPIAIILLATFSLGFGLLLSTITMYFPDIAEMYQVALIAWMYLTPIIYPVDIIPESYRFWLFHLNPMYYLIQIFRQPIYDGSLPSFPTLATGIGISVLTLFVGWVVFSHKANEFTYRT
jgi:ABC-2 type transport system permease protein